MFIDDIFDFAVDDDDSVKEEDGSAGTREMRLVVVVITKFRRVGLIWSADVTRSSNNKTAKMYQLEYIHQEVGMNEKEPLPSEGGRIRDSEGDGYPGTK